LHFLRELQNFHHKSTTQYCKLNPSKPIKKPKINNNNNKKKKTKKNKRNGSEAIKHNDILKVIRNNGLPEGTHSRGAFNGHDQLLLRHRFPQPSLSEDVTI
jgi:hypothetical protein